MSSVIESHVRPYSDLGIVVGARPAATLLLRHESDAAATSNTPDLSSPQLDASPDRGTAALEPDIQMASVQENLWGDHQQPLGGWAKRLLDLLVASTALILASPILVLIPLLIKATTGGPVLFVHRRIGFNGKVFDCYKFRTMVPNAEEVLQRHLSCDLQAAQEWAANQKLKCDPRILFFGKMLRKSSLDELPQLFNVLRGDMSCVGPRPVVADELQRYGAAAHEYLKTRPGLTGLWQISGRNMTEYSHRVLLDTQYVQTWSLLRDFSILMRTIPAMMKFDQTS
ncbi:exopolysaccharide biosynthesis protein [Mesorhizobium sp. M9A.F.Ca.ET.002.03.1.2]|uniref:sugar transferase n=1 Tax=Mesorhizobium sp. M9A.F.Ca.ET.002.03.1.2 TaxID=2493668 RepID=UPI000F754D15|nr:sugar transferase [Mesorhizobium sp. M9A.F.Ca.ET.002.03.1.2]AZN98789.1 exopolysaccharide biosynthesis protein [Mesorhizobium sp. M9A.F.Ca.ET.002.03.1.2]